MSDNITAKKSEVRINVHDEIKIILEGINDKPIDFIVTGCGTIPFTKTRRIVLLPVQLPSPVSRIILELPPEVIHSEDVLI